LSRSLLKQPGYGSKYPGWSIVAVLDVPATTNLKGTAGTVS